MTFSHYILTRFNLPLSSLQKGQTSAVCKPEYLFYRFSVFEKFCLPSVRNQTCQSFKWLVLFDNNTPESFKQRAAGWHRAFPNLIPCYLDVDVYGGILENPCPVNDVDTDGPMQQITSRFVTDVIRSMERTLPEWVLTTRLDSDDALHRDLVKVVQGFFLKNPKMMAFDNVFTYKYILDESIIYRYKLINGHYLTLAEKTGDSFRSVLFCNHLAMDKYVEVQHIYGRTLQTELIHSGNVVNGYTDLSISGLRYALFHFRGHEFGYDGVRFSRKKAVYMIGSLLKRRLWSKCAR